MLRYAVVGSLVLMVGLAGCERPRVPRPPYHEPIVEGRPDVAPAPPLPAERNGPAS